jgi:hypothetical protein
MTAFPGGNESLTIVLPGTLIAISVNFFLNNFFVGPNAQLSSFAPFRSYPACVCDGAWWRRGGDLNWGVADHTFSGCTSLTPGRSPGFSGGIGKGFACMVSSGHKKDGEKIFRVISAIREFLFRSV